MNKRKTTEILVGFSFKREVFFVVIGAILGAVFMLIPTAFEPNKSPYSLMSYNLAN